MFTKYSIISLLAASSSLLPCLATAAAAAGRPVLVPWSEDPKQCFPTYTCAADCREAYKALCAQVTATDKPQADPLRLDAQRVVVKSCLAYYHLGSNSGKSNKPFGSAKSCEAAFGEIIRETFVDDPENDPMRCGRPAGAVGYDANGVRTATPLYALMPSNGNPNCFKQAGDTSPIPDVEKLRDGSMLKTCPRSTSKRTDLAVRQTPASEAPSGVSLIKCGTEDLLTLTGCAATCIVSVLSTSWLTGPFAFFAGLGCVGLCDVVAVKVADNCMESEGGDLFKNYFDWSRKRDSMNLRLAARADVFENKAEDTTAKCLRLNAWSVCDGPSQNALSKDLGCPGAGSINF